MAGSPGTLRCLHEQLYGAHLDFGHNQRSDQGAHANLRQISATQASERDLHGPNHAHAVSAPPERAGPTREARFQYRPTVGKLAPERPWFQLGAVASSLIQVHDEHRHARCSHASTSRSFLDRCFDCRCDPVHKGAGMGARRSAPIME